MKVQRKHLILFSNVLLIILYFIMGCAEKNPTPPDPKTVPHQTKWGIYALDLSTETVELLYSDTTEISFLTLNNSGDRFAFSQKIYGDSDEHEEIVTLKIDGTDFKVITDNNFRDIYPCWSPDDSQIAFLTMRGLTLDIYVIDSAGNNETALYASEFHDADIDWIGDKIVFTRNSLIWIMNDDGTGDYAVTDNPLAGDPSNANLPFGDYDPRLRPDGQKILFERMDDDASIHGNYNIYVINPDGTDEEALTDNGYTQGIAEWSYSGEEIVFWITAINDVGKYDIYMMNADGSNYRDITPDYFPADFLCHRPIFSADDSKIYFVGEWWGSL